MQLLDAQAPKFEDTRSAAAGGSSAPNSSAIISERTPGRIEQRSARERDADWGWLGLLGLLGLAGLFRKRHYERTPSRHAYATSHRRVRIYETPGSG
jgi:MYXO-CTERM domain-containing protein